MNDQLGGVVRALGPLVMGILVGWGIDSTTAGLMTTALGAIVAAAWSWYTNSVVNKAKSLAAEPGVTVQVGHMAAPELKSLASDPEHPSVVVKT
jgi:hypothetical protein